MTDRPLSELVAHWPEIDFLVLTDTIVNNDFDKHRRPLDLAQHNAVAVLGTTYDTVTGQYITMTALGGTDSADQAAAVVENWLKPNLRDRIEARVLANYRAGHGPPVERSQEAKGRGWRRHGS
jgi:hypothetical protein